MDYFYPTHDRNPAGEPRQHPGPIAFARGPAPVRGRAIAFTTCGVLVMFAWASLAIAHAPGAASGSSKATGRRTPRPAAAAARPAHESTASVASDPEAAKRAVQLARDVRADEELGNYALAAEALHSLRGFAPTDPDLELALALDLARGGRVDSAAALLYDPVLSTALTDTLARPHFEVYGWRHEMTYFGGRFDGWYWYIARARLEVEATRGRWPEALAAARICVRSRPLAGIEWYLFALCAARGGAYQEAGPAAEKAARLAPMLPEAHYLAGVLAWRGGRRLAAQSEFRSAIEMDSSYREPAVALARVRLPVPADSLPSRLLGGLRQAELLTSSVQPKYDEFIELSRQAVVTRRVDVTIPDSLAGRFKPVVVTPLVLFDAHGQPVIHEDRWADSTSAPEAIVGLVSAAVHGWEVQPALKFGNPQPLWLELDVNVNAPEH